MRRSAHLKTGVEQARATNTASAYAGYADTADRRDEVRPDLRKLHDAARAELRKASVAYPDGLDPILDRLLDRVDHRVGLISVERTIDKTSFAAVVTKLATPGAEVAQLGDLFEKDYVCADGLTEAFKSVTGSDVITFTDEPGARIQLRLRWNIRASGTGYVEPNTKRVFPGIAISGRLEIVDENAPLIKMTFDVAPADNVEFSTEMLSGLFKSGRDAEVASGLVSAACKQLGFNVASKLTGWTAPPPPRKGLDDVVEACEGSHEGRACFEAGVQYRDGVNVPADTRRAEKLFDLGCSSGAIESGACCVAGAELVLKELPPGDSMHASEVRAHAFIMLQTGCNDHFPDACAGAGAAKLRPYPGESAPSQYAIGEALPFLVRACDLGAAGACKQAASLLAKPGISGAPSFAGAARLAKRACGEESSCPDADRLAKQAGKEKSIFDIPLGTDRVFDIRWGDWFDLDQGQLVAWVASSHDEDALRTRLGAAVGAGTARIYAPDKLPFGVKPPPGTNMVWAVIAGRPTFKDDRPCRECMTGEASDPMMSIGCVCLPLK